MSKNSRAMQNLAGYVPIADFYSTTPQFKLRGKSRYSSCLSLLLSVAIFIFIFVIFIYLCVILANKRNPTVVVSELPNDTENEDLYLFTPDSTFQMGFGVVFLYGIPANMYGGIYTAKAAVRYLDPETNTYAYMPIEIETCQPYHFPQYYPDYARLLCFKQQTPAQTAALYVRTKEERSIIVQFYQCDNATNQCDDNINTMLYYSGFVTLRTSWSVDPLNYSNPVSWDMEETFAGIPRGIRRELTMSVSTIEFSSDNGWLFKSTKTEKVYNLEAIDQDMYNITLGDFERAFGITQAPFLTLIIANSGDKEMQTRKYKKIQDVFAEVTGLTAVLIPIIGILLLPSLKYARLKVYEKTANDLYQARKEDLERYYKERRRHQHLNGHKSHRKSRSRQATAPARRQSTAHTVGSVIELPDLQTNPSAESHQIPGTSVIQGNAHDVYNQLQMQSDREREHGPVKISFFKWVKSFCRPEPEIKILSQAIEEIEATMDIGTIIEKLMEIEKLKRCIMTEDQRILFDNLDKPVFFVDGSKISQEQNQNQNQNDERGQVNGGEPGSHKPTPEEVYENLKGKEVISDLEKQLLLFYEKKIK